MNVTVDNLGVVYGDQTTVELVPSGENAFPFAALYPVNHIALNNEILKLKSLISNASIGGSGGGSGLRSIILDFPQDVSDILEGTYDILLLAQEQTVLESVDYTVGNTGGSFVLRVVNAGSDVSGLTVTIDNSNVQASTATANNVVGEGYRVQAIISSISGHPQGVCIQFNFNSSGSTDGGGVTPLVDYEFVDEAGDSMVDENGDQLVFAE